MKTRNQVRGIDVPILLYHHLIPGDCVDPNGYEISSRQFEEQLDCLRRWGFETVTFAQLLTAQEEGDDSLPRRPVIVSFDDGFRSFLDLGLPALRARAMQATMFVPAGEIGGTNRWDAAQDRDTPERHIVDESELKYLAGEGTEIGSHGWIHRALPDCNEAEAREEIFRSRERLRDLGFAADFFSYPYGAFSARDFSLLEAAGYKGAAAMFTDSSRVTSERFAIRRIYIHPGDTRLRFRVKLSPLYLRYAALRGYPLV